MPAIFISYRRDDTQGEAGRLYDYLVQVFGKNSVFMDVTGIELGCDFRQAIHNQISTCDILLALIGQEWRSSAGNPGTSRLEDPKDFVRIETSAALKRGIPVIPVLLKGAKLPDEEQLPSDLKELCYRNAIEVTHARWSTDLITLNETISRLVGLHPNSKNIQSTGITFNSYYFKLKHMYTVILGFATLLALYFLFSSRPVTRQVSFRLDPSKPQPDSVKGIIVDKDAIIKIVPKDGIGKKIWNCKGQVGIIGESVGFSGDNSFSRQRDDNLMSPDAPFCSLIYSIGTDSTQWKELPNKPAFRADAIGELYLTVNDVVPKKCTAMPDKEGCYRDNKLIQETGDNIDITITSNMSGFKQILLFLGFKNIQ